MTKTIPILGLLAILPLLTVSLATNYDAFAAHHGETDIVCVTGEVLVIRVTNPNPVCVSEEIALRWVELGLATIVKEMTDEEVEDAYEKVPLDEVEAAAEEKMEEQAAEIEDAQQEAMEEEREEAMHSDSEETEELPSAAVSKQFATGTITSIQDPGVGHEGHQLAVLLAPSENVYAGQLTYSASENVQLVSLHGPLSEGEDNGQPTWTPDGETKFALTFVDAEAAAGGWFFSGNALALHTMNEEPFTATYSISYVEIAPGDYVEGVVRSDTVESIQDPGIGHESHSLAILLPPSDEPYHDGILSYSASEPIQLVALHGPLAIGEDSGQPIWTPDGETKYALTFVNAGEFMGTWTFTGNALAAHTMNPDGFTISYSVATRN